MPVFAGNGRCGSLLTADSVYVTTDNYSVAKAVRQRPIEPRFRVLFQWKCGSSGTSLYSALDFKSVSPVAKAVPVLSHLQRPLERCKALPLMSEI